MTTNSILLNTGYCKCHTAPQGRDGLEGLFRDQVYLYALRRTSETGRKYYRIYLFKNFKCDVNRSDYEVCSTGKFSRYFEIRR